MPPRPGYQFESAVREAFVEEKTKEQEKVTAYGYGCLRYHRTAQSHPDRQEAAGGDGWGQSFHSSRIDRRYPRHSDFDHLQPRKYAPGGTGREIVDKGALLSRLSSPLDKYRPDPVANGKYDSGVLLGAACKEHEANQARWLALSYREGAAQQGTEELGCLKSSPGVDYKSYFPTDRPHTPTRLVDSMDALDNRIAIVKAE
ncbi:hypothetical protein C8F01DRAFT_1252335 [Mycena amicta]|nr:hypothetical protein C8F01DRAFT_1252335 [Mycena amicta]